MYNIIYIFRLIVNLFTEKCVNSQSLFIGDALLNKLL